MKARILFLCLLPMCAFADDAQKIVDRKTCEQIKTEIADLSAIQNPTAEDQETLKQLNAQQRTYCAIKGNGRRTISRPGANMSATPSENIDTKEPVTTGDVLEEYIAAKKANCEKLNAGMEKLKSDTSKEYIVKEMQRYYNADCVTITPTAEPVEAVVSTVVTSETTVQTISDEEFNANIAAGLCGDGTKPNKFGCCADEVFRDMGNTVFACCPRSGGDCFPPITKAQ